MTSRSSRNSSFSEPSAWTGTLTLRIGSPCFALNLAQSPRTSAFDIQSGARPLISPCIQPRWPDVIRTHLPSPGVTWKVPSFASYSHTLACSSYRRNSVGRARSFGIHRGPEVSQSMVATPTPRMIQLAIKSKSSWAGA